MNKQIQDITISIKNLNKTEQLSCLNQFKWIIDNTEDLKRYRRNYYATYFTDETKRLRNLEAQKRYKAKKNKYIHSWGGSPAFFNNLLNIDINCFF